MADLRDELKCWLDDNPAPSIVEPKPASKFSMTFFNRRESMSRTARKGDDAIVEDCVRGIMNPLRNVLSGGTDLDEAAAADLSSTEDIDHLITRGDPDYASDYGVTLRLEWDDYPMVRIVVTGVGDTGDALYYGQWQTRSDVDSPWTPATPLRSALGRLWFPTDYSARARLGRELAADKPSHGPNISP